ncbi:hypothetical protein DW820_09965 [Streptococcus parasanguinis]|jgi:hypothetical protein|uniref:Uncharacterized protein n=1 Tax=Streptococcus parasanguinis TaxID=1318 RepID=A0A414CEQ9_STRPA|nr:hypothetical protein [Streptococcus parasanguinis]RHC93508.1 hypothetical protein DW820_09965 [Streptococcus parasanguinis]
MSSKEYGSYNFREGFKIDEGNFKNLLPTSIIKHESTHYKSFVFSIFGTFYRMWSKLLDLQELRRSKPLFDHLQMYFSKMQEQAATYNEIVDELSKLDESEYDDYLKNFRDSNKKYYKYFDAMRRNSNGVLGTLHIKEINAAKNTDKLHELIDTILFLSFSIDIKQFSLEKWQKITDIDSDMTTNEQLNPNKRFQMILNNLIYDPQGNCITIDMESLSETLRIPNPSDYDTLDDYHKIFERLLGKKYSLPILILISKSGVETDESIFKDEVLMAYPSLPIFRPTENLFLNPIKLLDANNVLGQKEKYKYAQIITQNYFKSWAIHLINETKMVIIEDVNEMSSAMLLLNQLIKQFDLTVTTSSKLPFKILDRIEYDVFVFMTRPISENLKYINDEYRDGYYNIVKNDDMNFLLVKKNRIMLIQPLIASQINLVKSRLDQIANKNFLMLLSNKALESIDLYFMDRQLNADDKMIDQFFSNLNKANDEYLRLGNT